MKKTFPLKAPNQADERVLEAVKFELRKYLKRERRKEIPEGFNRWDFACKIGADQAAAKPEPVDGLFASLEAVARSGSPQVYVEILAQPGKYASAAGEEPPAQTGAS